MQPYFFPYPGYFRLLADTDVFVYLDDVQFPRSGWVHRNKFEFLDSSINWLTLPVTRGSRESTTIVDLSYREEDKASFYRRFFSTRFLSNIPENLINFDNSVVIDLKSQIEFIAKELRFFPEFYSSSQLAIPSDFSGQRRIIEICKVLNASKYINLNGGIKYYDSEEFRKFGIKLEILQKYEGTFSSVIDSLSRSSKHSIRREIISNLKVCS